MDLDPAIVHQASFAVSITMSNHGMNLPPTQDAAIPWLRVAVAGEAVLIGPWLNLPGSPCLGCAEHAISTMSPAVGDRHDDAAPWPALVAAEIFGHASGVMAGCGSCLICCHDKATLKTTWLPALSRPGCGVCGSGPPGKPWLASAYAQLGDILSPFEGPVPYCSPRRRYKADDYWALPKLLPTGVPTAQTDRQCLSAQAMVRLLAAAAGPSPASVLMYLLARDIAGLDDGVYLYDPRDMGVVRIVAGRQWEMAVRTDPPLAGDGPVVILAADLAHLSRQLGGASLELGLHGVGAVLTRLCAAAQPHLRAEVVSRWSDEPLEQVIGLGQDHELLGAVVSLTPVEARWKAPVEVR
jgi:hypothetical protein